MLHAVIMAGGSGTRFWPASRSVRPKQLLELAGKQSMIQATVSRLGKLVSPDRVLIVTNQRLVGPISAQLPQLPTGAVLGEPCKRDTAPCIGLAAASVGLEDPEAVMAVMPADHVITSDEVFQAAIQRAVGLVDQDPSRLVTFGISPTYPAESFGYIERGEKVGEDAYRVNQFREKPQAEVAKRYLESGSFYWNSGIFVWRAQTILDLLEQYEPSMFAHITKIRDALGTDHFQDVLQTEFTQIVGKSIDYAVMERAEEVVVIEAPFRWDDVGSWTSLERLHDQTDEGNTIMGKCVAIDSSNSVLRSEGEHLIATVGVKDLIVVHTPDATLVANRHDEESVRKIVQLLEKEGLQQYL